MGFQVYQSTASGHNSVAYALNLVCQLLTISLVMKVVVLLLKLPCLEQTDNKGGHMRVNQQILSFV